MPPTNSDQESVIKHKLSVEVEAEYLDYASSGYLANNEKNLVQQIQKNPL